MLLLWPSKKPITVVQRKIKAIGLDALITTENATASNYKIPIIFDEVRGIALREFHEFLYEKSFYSDYYKSDKTVSTYAESLLSWLKFTSLHNIDWSCASSRNIALYRNSMRSGNGREIKPSSAATINLRLAVVYEFYKYYWAHSLAEATADRELFAHRLNKLRDHVRVKAIKKGLER